MPDLTSAQLREYLDRLLYAMRYAVRGDLMLAAGDVYTLTSELQEACAEASQDPSKCEQFDVMLSSLTVAGQDLVTAMEYLEDDDEEGAKKMLGMAVLHLQNIPDFLKEYEAEHSGSAEAIDVRPEPKTDSSIERAMEDSLERLLERKSGDGFVIFENPESDQFVQFARFHQGGAPMLLLDLPYTQLKDGKDKKLKALLEESRGDVLQDSSESIVFHFGQDAPHAAAVAHRIMQEVYGLGDSYELRMEEH